MPLVFIRFVDYIFLSTAFNIGKGAIAGGAVIGLGCLCYYGLGLSSQTGVIDQARYVIY